MRVGTVVKASRKQIGIAVLFDGDESPAAYRHDDVINRVEGLTDLLDGRGVTVGMRVESVRQPEGWRLRLTGEVVPCEPEPEPQVRSSDQSKASILSVGGREAIDIAFGFAGAGQVPMDDEDVDEALYGK
jgi:hypothetical protein